MQLRIRVLLADDHPVWRNGLQVILEPACWVVAHASDGQEAVEKALECEPDVVVLDIGMPGMDGIAAARQLKTRLPGVGVVILTASATDEDLFDAVGAGIDGYLTKDAPAESILEAVRSAARSEAYLPPDVAKRVLQRLASQVNGAPAQQSKHWIALSAREEAVLRLMAEGQKNKDIARILHISERTVGNQITTIYKKLSIGDRAHAIQYAIKNGLATPGTDRARSERRARHMHPEQGSGRDVHDIATRALEPGILAAVTAIGS